MEDLKELVDKLSVLYGTKVDVMNVDFDTDDYYFVVLKDQLRVLRLDKDTYNVSLDCRNIRPLNMDGALYFVARKNDGLYVFLDTRGEIVTDNVQSYSVRDVKSMLLHYDGLGYIVDVNLKKTSRGYNRIENSKKSFLRVEDKDHNTGFIHTSGIEIAKPEYKTMNVLINDEKNGQGILSFVGRNIDGDLIKFRVETFNGEIVQYERKVYDVWWINK